LVFLKFLEINTNNNHPLSPHAVKLCRTVQLSVVSTICCRTRGFLRERRFESARVPSSCH